MKVRSWESFIMFEKYCLISADIFRIFFIIKIDIVPECIFLSVSIYLSHLFPCFGFYQHHSLCLFPESSLGLAFSHRTIPLSLTANVQHLQPASELHTISTSVTPEQPSRLLTYTSYIGLPQRFLTVTPLATTAEPAPIKSMFIKPLGHNVHKLEDKLSPNKETEVRINVTDIGGSGRNSNLATSNTSILGKSSLFFFFI